MTAFQPVNAALAPKEYDSATSPTTPRAPSHEKSGPSTPTRSGFGGLEGQRALPSSPFNHSFSSQPPAVITEKVEPGILTRGNSHQSTLSTDSQDVEMNESDDEGEGESDVESIDGDTGRPSKKKKFQRFFCNDYPPCNLSFTRSEHLARHIRKHTGERPFQCHCSRRFSRLDNLRQHAQTVHVNEEIPGDSLAATGTRFQRQIRTDRVRAPTDRVRTPTGRARASTVNSQPSHGRGHGRNLSTSSIGSTSSTLSRDDSRRRPSRPQPLMMAGETGTRSRLTLDTVKAQASISSAHYGHSRDSSDCVSTPTSTTFSNGQNSPGYGSSLGSPISNMTRNYGLWGSSVPGRRLSVPSGTSPFQSAHGNTYPPSHLSPLLPSNSSNVSISNSSSVYGSPTTSTYPYSRRDSGMAVEVDRRRRTWHPSTYSSHSRPATSGLSFYQNADAPRPAFAPQPAAPSNQMHRLPGIETFDQIAPRPASPPHRGPSPMQVDSPNRPPIFSGPSEQTTSGPNDRRGHASWDKSLHHNLTRLDIANANPAKDTLQWTQQPVAEPQDTAPRSTVTEGPMYRAINAQQALQPAPVIHQEQSVRPADSSYMQTTTQNKKKRHGWYNGPLTPLHQTILQQRTSPEDSSSSEGVPTPSYSYVEYHPSIIHSNGYIESSHVGPGAAHNIYSTGHVRAPGYPLSSESNVVVASQHHSSKRNDLSGLEALVAVATNEDKAAAPQLHQITSQ